MWRIVPAGMSSIFDKSNLLHAIAVVLNRVRATSDQLATA